MLKSSKFANFVCLVKVMKKVIFIILIFLATLNGLDKKTLDKSCRLGNANACYDLYYYTYKNTNKKLINKYLKLGCDANDYELCTIYAKDLAKKDVDKSIKIFEKYCFDELKIGACKNLEHTLFFDKYYGNYTKDMILSMAKIEKTLCNLSKSPCDNTKAYINPLYQECEQNDAYACLLLANYAYGLNNMAFNFAMKLWDKSCKLKNAKACFMLGFASVKFDYKISQKAFLNACNLDKSYCNDYTYTYNDNIDYMANNLKAKCLDKDSKSCLKLLGLFDKGSVFLNSNELLKYYQNACINDQFGVCKNNDKNYQNTYLQRLKSLKLCELKDKNECKNFYKSFTFNIQPNSNEFKKWLLFMQTYEIYDSSILTYAVFSSKQDIRKIACDLGKKTNDKFFKQDILKRICFK